MGEIGKREKLPHSSLHVWMDVCEKLKPTMFASWLLFLRNFCSEWDWKQSNKKYLFHNITMGIISVFFQKTSIKISVTMWGEGSDVLANPNFKWERKTLLFFSAFVQKPPSPKCPFPLPPYQPAAFWISKLEKLLVAFARTQSSVFAV